MSFLKKYWYLLLVTIITVGIGVVAYLTSIKLEQRQPVAPTVPQVSPKATDINCKIVFTLGTHTPTPTCAPRPRCLNGDEFPECANMGVPAPLPPGGWYCPVTPTPTPTPTVTPTGTPGPTSTPTPTTPANNTKPVCVDLTVEPAIGTVPYTVTLTCTGRDEDGDITAAEFTMPDGSKKLVEQNVGSPGSLTTTYTVTTSGAYSFSCQVRDNNNAWISSDACRISTGPTAPPGSTATPAPLAVNPTPKVPVAGVPSVLGASVVAGGILLLLLGLAF